MGKGKKKVLYFNDKSSPENIQIEEELVKVSIRKCKFIIVPATRNVSICLETNFSDENTDKALGIIKQIEILRKVIFPGFQGLSTYFSLEDTGIPVFSTRSRVNK